MVPQHRLPHAHSAHLAHRYVWVRLGAGLARHGELVGLRQVEVAMVAAQALRHQGRRGAAQDGRLAWRTVQAHPAQEARREGVAAAGGVDDLDLEGGDGFRALGGDE